MKLLNHFETTMISAAQLDFGNGVIATVDLNYAGVPIEAGRFIETYLQQVINGQLQPSAFMEIMKASEFMPYLEPYMDELPYSF